MLIIKSIILILIFATSIRIGTLKANKYKNRVMDLKEMKNALNMFKTKIKFTYEPIPEIFSDISDKMSINISSIFVQARDKMKKETAGRAWIETLEESRTNMNKEDIKIVEGLSKLLGQTDIEGQISEIELTQNFLEMQIVKAEKEQEKNEKLYKNMGVIIGLAIVIVLI